MSAIYSRGQQLAKALSALLVVLSAATLLTVVVQLVIAALGGAAPDAGWAVLAPVCVALAVWSRSASGLPPLLSAEGEAPHRRRVRAVWCLLFGGFLLVAGLKLGSADVDAYKRLVFGEGGLVEWTQVLILGASVRAAWLIGGDLDRRLIERVPGFVARGCSLLLALVLLEELAWGQVIFGWRTPETLREINAQNETTLHNIDWFQERLDSGYFLVTVLILVVVVLAPRLLRQLGQRCSEPMARVLNALSPAAYGWPLFLAVAVLAFSIATRSLSDVILNRDQEWGELLLYGALLLGLLRTRVLLGPVQHAP